MFCCFGSLHQKLRVGGPPTGSAHRDGSFFLCIVSGASVCCGRCTSSLVLYSLTGATLQRHFLCAVAAAAFYVHVAAATSASCRGTSQQDIAFQMFLQIQTLRRLASRHVAAGVSPSPQDVAASQYVCSRGADNLSSYVSSFGSDLSSTCFGSCFGRCRLQSGLRSPVGDCLPLLRGFTVDNKIDEALRHNGGPTPTWGREESFQLTREECSAPAFGGTSPTCRLQSEVPSNSDLERHSVAVQETEQWVGLCLVPVRFRTYDEQLEALTQVPSPLAQRSLISQLWYNTKYRSRRKYLSASILIGNDVPEERPRQVPTNQIIQRTVERTLLRVRTDHPEVPEDCRYKTWT